MKLRQHSKLLRQQGRRLQKDPLFETNIGYQDKLLTIFETYQDINMLIEKLAAGDQILGDQVRTEVRDIEDRLRRYTKLLFLLLNTKIAKMLQ